MTLCSVGGDWLQDVLCVHFNCLPWAGPRGGAVWFVQAMLWPISWAVLLNKSARSVPRKPVCLHWFLCSYCVLAACLSSRDGMPWGQHTLVRPSWLRQPHQEVWCVGMHRWRRGSTCASINQLLRYWQPHCTVWHSAVQPLLMSFLSPLLCPCCALDSSGWYACHRPCWCAGWHGQFQAPPRGAIKWTWLAPPMCQPG